MTDQGFTITDPGSPKVQAIFLRAHLRLRAAGRRSRFTNAVLLGKAEKITGNTYAKRSPTAIITAINDLCDFIAAN